jgi:RNA polymerase sigma-70 factor (ECF subfamily)
MAQVLAFRPVAAPLDDGALVERAREGADWAKAELFQRHGPAVLKSLTRLLNSTTDAEDAAQDTFLEAFRDLALLRQPAHFSRWVLRIAVHQAHRRFARRRLLSFIGMSTPGLDATLDQLADQRASPEVRAELALAQKVLRGLGAVERSAWILRFVEGRELTEVAELMELSLATVKRKLQRAQVAIAEATGWAGGDE